MAYLGSPLSGYDATLDVRVDVFSGNGSATDFTMSYTVSHPKDIEVVVDDVQQNPYDNSYSVSGVTLSLTTPPSNGANNVYVVHRDYFQISTPPDINSIITDYIANQSVTTEKLGTHAVTSVKLANTLSLGTVTTSGPVVSSNTLTVNTRASSANHATQKQYVDALTIVFGA
jgi:hypothetical protein